MGTSVVQGMKSVLIHGGTALAQAQPEEWDMCIGRPFAFHHRRCRALEDHLLSSHHQCTGTTHRNHARFTWVKDVGMQLATVEEIRTTPQRSLHSIHDTIAAKIITDLTRYRPIVLELI